MSDDPQANLQAGLDAMQAEGQGVWRMAVLSRRDVGGVEARAARGDAEASALARSIAGYMHGVKARPPGDPIMCLVCAAAFSASVLPETIATLSADVPGTQHHIVSGICAGCHWRADLRPAVRAVYRESLGMDLRILDIAAPGHA